MKKRATLYLLMFCLCVSFLSADIIKLKSGDVIHGMVMEDRDDALVIQHDDLGELTIGKDKVVSVEAISATTPEEAKAQKKDYFLKKGYDFVGLNDFSARRKAEGWSAALNVSIDNSYGNTDEQAMRFGGKLGHKNERNRFKMDFAYYHKDKESNTTDNKYTHGLLYDWLLPESKWFYFVTGRYDYDQFESWLHRVSTHAGPGYRLINEELFTLDARGGAGARKEWKSDNDSVRFEGLFGLDLSWQMSERQNLSLNTAIYPVYTDINDYRTRTSADWKFLLDQDMKLSFNIGVVHEYQSVVDPGDDKNDLRLFSGIQYDF